MAPSLGEINGSIRVAPGAPPLRKFLAFAGPGYLVAAGYMDPGNWATAIAAGSGYGYALLCVVVSASLVAMLFQSLCARLGIGAGLDLAQATRRQVSPRANLGLWALAEMAVVATDLAELIGAAIALKLLFGLPLTVGVLLTALDAFLVLWLMGRGVRWVEAFVSGMIFVTAAAFAFNLALAQPEIGALVQGFFPRGEQISDATLLILACGIIGATVMPHNLYLHSALAQSRSMEGDRRAAIHYASLDSTVALGLAMLVNCSLLVLAAAAFHKEHSAVAGLEEAHALLAPVLGHALAPVAFAVALLACGVSSTVTGTLAGQVVMEGFLHLRLAPWLRRLATRGMAIIPAIAVASWYGSDGIAKLLVASQVVLSLQLPFAMLPLLRAVGSRELMGPLVAPRWQLVLAWCAAALVVLLNLAMLALLFSTWGN
ncbi:MAG: Nramp family divalent metal transporter [Burkholderiales bacterium]|nr:Nramp family divalent metal transporter [Burkholderiales bacterium]